MGIDIGRKPKERQHWWCVVMTRFIKQQRIPRASCSHHTARP